MIFAMYSTDAFHVHKNYIYRINTEVKTGHYHEFELATSPAPLKHELIQYEEVEFIARVWNRFFDNAISETKKLPVSGYFADPEFLKIFSFELTYGDDQNALDNPYSIVLTKEWAEKFFGDQNPIGKTINFNELGQFTVTGLFEPMHNKKSHMNFDLIASSKTLQMRTSQEREINDKDINPYGFTKALESWKDVYRTYTYIKLKDKADQKSIKAIFPSIINRHYDDPASEYMYYLQPF
jgi:putative ABC transport system permease protein